MRSLSLCNTSDARLLRAMSLVDSSHKNRDSAHDLSRSYDLGPERSGSSASGVCLLFGRTHARDLEMEGSVVVFQDNVDPAMRLFGYSGGSRGMGTGGVEQAELEFVAVAGRSHDARWSSMIGEACRSCPWISWERTRMRERSHVSVA